MKSEVKRKRLRFTLGGRVRLHESYFGRAYFRPSPAPYPAVHFNSKSNMAGLIYDRELITLARTNKTPALQATYYQRW